MRNGKAATARANPSRKPCAPGRFVVFAFPGWIRRRRKLNWSWRKKPAASGSPLTDPLNAPQPGALYCENSAQNKTPQTQSSHGTLVDQPSPKCCSRRRLKQGPKAVNGPVVPYPTTKELRNALLNLYPFSTLHRTRQ